MVAAVDRANVAQYAGGANETSHAVSITTAPAAGALVVVCVAVNNQTSVVTSVTDSKGNTWTVDVTETSTSGVSSSIASCVPTVPLLVADTITVNIGLSATMAVQVSSFTGCAAKDKTAVNQQPSPNAFTVGPTAALAATGELAVATFTSTGSPASAAGAGYTAIVLDLATTGSFIRKLSVEYKIGATQAGETATLNTNTSTNWSAALAVYTLAPDVVVPAAASSSETVVTWQPLLLDDVLDGGPRPPAATPSNRGDGTESWRTGRYD